MTGKWYLEGPWSSAGGADPGWPTGFNEYTGEGGPAEPAVLSTAGTWRAPVLDADARPAAPRDRES